MDKKQAIERFNNHLLKIQQPYMYEEDKQAVKVAVKSMEKLEKIKHIVNEWNNDASHSFEDMCKINGILKE